MALFSGLAGSVAVSRAGSGAGVTTLPGVAIAVALMPPLCTIGFGLGSGANVRIMGGAGLLFLTNLVAIVASAFAVFLLVGMNSSEIRPEMAHSREAEPLARAIAAGPFSRILINSGQLHWRIVMLLVVLAAVAAPLRTALLQVAGEALARGVVQEVIKGLVPAKSMLSQQVEVGKESIAVRLISTQRIAEEKRREAERTIEMRTARRADLAVTSIASQSELAELTQRISLPPPAPPKPEVKTLEEIHRELIDRMKPVVEGVWPPEAPIDDFDLSFGPDTIALDVRYRSEQVLGQIPLDMIIRQVRERMVAPGVVLKARRVGPPTKMAAPTARMAK